MTLIKLNNTINVLNSLQGNYWKLYERYNKKLDKVRNDYKKYLINDISIDDLENFFNVLEKIENNIMKYDGSN